MSVYVLHFDPPFAHARHYIGFTPDPTVARRVSEHMTCGPRGNPLVKAAIGAGCAVTLAHAFEGEVYGRDFERNLKARRTTRAWCACCGVGAKPVPSPSSISARFRAAKAY
ncbi:endonuclease [Methylobacterium gnaphalii]|uniref:GIY-YIG domain-containing protein n=1 Tax=Methylobacterium gnaphalii TaxID=1010610 RepID=A0A512JPL3_9HYPH|nr:endonuclease [Methylobacterium gnaphalii]GEP11803.1 hypothetical protein MGN01_36480 [Methylobacterium gnaphalii]GJD69480.1 hypothetical protein MMMDOFMJ_2411 [Methylobacterium gnaphalii]GLS49562.1 hypothetical protein GCM10007885_24110 [Methylobacterium gnaphalii]